ncbi:MAG: carboxylating nicotinate-nucleotide diphosphorylase, partial [Ktedonobacterales bacterium]
MSDTTMAMRNPAAFDPVFDAELVRRALAEDVGRGDVTTEATIPAGTQASGRIVARQPGVVAGLPIAALTFR